ncbi:hypothetical protein V6N13_034468 [Hibiscus sabdariffa]
MRFLLWLAWCWFGAPSRSVVTRGGWIWFRCHVLPGSAGILTLVAALLAGFGDAGLRCRSPCDALQLFRSHVSFVSVRVSVLLVALLLTDFGRRLLFLSFAHFRCPLAEILSCFLLPLWLCIGGSLHPLPLPCSRAWHGAFPRPLWPCPAAFSVIPSFYGVVRGWRILDCLRITLLCIRTCLVRFVVYGCACCPCSVLQSMAAPAPRVPPLLGPSVLGGSRSLGCAAKAPSVVRFCAAKAPTPPCAVLPYAAKATRAGSVCAAKAHRASAPCAAKATRVGSVCAPLVLTGDFRPICGLRPPLLGVQVLALGPTCGPCIACLASFAFSLLLLLVRASVPAPAASDVAASDVPVTAGRVATGSAPMSAPPPRG